MSADLELEVWREQWQEVAPMPEGLQEKVDRQSRLMKLGIVCDVLVTLLIGGGTTVWAILSRDSGLALVAVAAWLFLAVAWIFVLNVNRGLWAPAALDAAAFLDLSVRRCHGALRTIWFAAELFVAEVAFGLAWARMHSNARKSVLAWLAFSSLRIDIVWVCTGLFFVMLFWYRSRKKQELARLVQMEAEIAGGNGGDK